MQGKLHDYHATLKRLISEQKCIEKFQVSSGCCVICYIANPLLLVQHHPFGRNNSGIEITVCANHHQIFNRLQGSWPEDWLSHKPKSPQVMQALCDRALADLLKVRTEYLRGLDYCEK